MPDKDRLTYIFSVKEPTYVVPWIGGQNVGAESVANRAMYPVLLLKKGSRDGKRVIDRIPAVFFTGSQLRSLFQVLETLFGSWEDVVKVIHEKMLVLALIPYVSGRGYSIKLIPVNDYMKMVLGREIGEEQLRSHIFNLQAFENVFAKFDGQQIAEWYDHYTYEKGWLNDRQKAMYREKYGKTEEEPQPVEEDGGGVDDLFF